MAYIDKLTSLQTLSWVRDRWEGFSNSLAEVNTLLYFDIDTLICFTDVFGSQESDKKLLFVANIIRKFIPDKYPVVRFAGEEFMSLVNDKDFSEKNLAELLRKLDLPDYKIKVEYSDIDHFSVSGCMIGSVNPKSFQELGQFTDQAIDVIEKNKSRIKFRKYKHQGVMVVKR